MTSIVAELNQKLEMVHGDSASWQGQMRNPDTDQFINLNVGSFLITFTVKHDYCDTDAQAVIQKTVGSGITIQAGSNGLYTVALLPADTSSLPNELTGYVFDVQMVDASGSKTTPARGTLLVYPETTLS